MSARKEREKIVVNTVSLKQITKDALCSDSSVQKEDVRHLAINSGLQETCIVADVEMLLQTSCGSICTCPESEVRVVEY